ncbi:MAG: ArgE/DapE family deacylase [Isosphaeraceae bacterium]
MDAVSRLLSDLVSIPSVNPMGRPLVGSDFLETSLSTYLVQWFSALGVCIERQRIAPGRENVIARFESVGAARTILFDAHQDTVPVDGMTIDPFLPRIEAGRLYGRGACDIKGGMAAMLMAFARLVREKPANAASIVMACTVDEEYTHTGSTRLASSPHGATLAIVAEPTLLRIVNCHKGAVRWKVRTRGVACHSSTPELGNNAIYRMAPIVNAIAAHAQELRASTPHPVLGAPSLSIGRIEGGQSVNVVPDCCEIEIDRRVIPGERASDCVARVERAVRARIDNLEDVEFLSPWVNMPPLSPESTSGQEWVERVISAISRVSGKIPAQTGVPYGTDAGPLSEGGLPCLVFGPGDIAQAHTKDEWVELDQVRQAVDMYYEIAVSLGAA